MPRYFQSLGAGRHIEIGGRSFIFEPVEPMGGSWIGVLAVDDESASSILAGAGLEITAEAYDQIKKKVSGQQTAQGYVPSPTPPRLPPQPIVVDASRAADRTAFTSSQPAVAAAPTPTKTVELQTTRLRPPADPLIDEPAVKARKAA